jgi:alpha-D-xyloside xylohydrolase
MRRRGFLAGTGRGLGAHKRFMDTYADGPVDITYYDATHPEARRFLWEKLCDNYYRLGIRAFWLDACEPEINPPQHENLRYHLGGGAEVGGLYPLLHQQGVYEGLKSAGEPEILTLCRSAWAGSQRYGACVWSGDIASTFDVLRAQVPAGLNMALSGIPWWNTDIGGFHDGDPAAPGFRELIVRWFQYGVFCPLFRLHGCRKGQGQGRISGGPNEVWSFGDEAGAIIREQLFLRERLKPYLLAQMRVASEAGLPPLRPLFLEFPEDRNAGEVADEFLLGKDVLVAPVVHEGARQRAVYLPEGAAWTDAWTGAAHRGGQTLQADAPLERIPVFLRDGAQWPIRKPE